MSLGTNSMMIDDMSMIAKHPSSLLLKLCNLGSFLMAYRIIKLANSPTNNKGNSINATKMFSNIFFIDCDPNFEIKKIYIIFVKHYSRTKNIYFFKTKLC